MKTYLIDGYDDDLNNEKGNLFEGLLGGFGNSLTQLGVSLLALGFNYMSIGS